MPLIDLDIDKVVSCEITVNSAIQNHLNEFQWLNDDSVGFNLKFQQNAITKSIILVVEILIILEV